MKCAVISLVLLFAFTAYGAESIPHWQVIPDKSNIEWTASYSGKPIKGQFPAFESDIAFDPTHLDKSYVKVQLELGKLKSQDKDAMQNLPTKEWFFVDKYPLAVFAVKEFIHLQGDNYEAHGMLTIKGKEIKVNLPFTVKFLNDNSDAVINGETTIKRLDFGIGEGEWATTNPLADEVKLAIHIEAKQMQ